MRQLLVHARLHLFPPHHCAGAEMMVVELLKALIARGHRCEVYLSRHQPAATGPYTYQGIPVFPRECYDPGAVWRSDVLLSHLENVPATGIAAMRTAKPFIHVVHNTHARTRSFLSGRTDLTVYNSEWMADELGRGPNTIIVRPPVWAHDYRVPTGTRITLVNLWADKGGELFWRLAAAMPDREFLGVQGAYGQQVEGDLPNVMVLPHGQYMRSVYGMTRVLLMPSKYESWGRCAVEAAASGIPTIAHPTPGLRESLGRAGIFVNRDNLDGWVQAIRHLEVLAAYRVARTRALTRSHQLDPTDDLNRWCDAVEAVAS